MDHHNVSLLQTSSKCHHNIQTHIHVNTESLNVAELSQVFNLLHDLLLPVFGSLVGMCNLNMLLVAVIIPPVHTDCEVVSS